MPFTISWWTPAEESSCAARDYAMVDPEARDFRFSKKIRNVDYVHRMGILAHEVGHVLAHAHWGDDSEDGADAASAEFLGIQIYYDHAYGSGGKGLQTMRAPRTKRNPPNTDRDKFMAELENAFEISPAVIVTRMYGKARHEHLWIFSPSKLYDGRDGYRVTMFDHDGPMGHEEAETIDDLLEQMKTFGVHQLEPVGDDAVMAWTTTPEFIDGSKRVLYTQKWNELGYAASVDPSMRERIDRARSHGDDLAHTDIDAAIRELERVTREMRPRGAVANPFRANPTPWVTKILGSSFEQLESLVPAAWLPKITNTKGDRATFSGKLEEFGCGAYGCVLPTLDPSIVLKVTTDITEADFARRLAEHLPTPICTQYYRVANITGMQRGPRDGVRKSGGDPIFLLWREEAKEVGKIDKVVGRDAEDAISVQHDAAKHAYMAIVGELGDREIAKRMKAWRAACADMAHIPELEFVSEGLLAAEKLGIFISDIHGGNLGVALRYGKPTWIITDPGNIVVTNADLAKA